MLNKRGVHLQLRMGYWQQEVKQYLNNLMLPFSISPWQRALMVPKGFFSHQGVGPEMLGALNRCLFKVAAVNTIFSHRSGTRYNTVINNNYANMILLLITKNSMWLGKKGTFAKSSNMLCFWAVLSLIRESECFFLQLHGQISHREHYSCNSHLFVEAEIVIPGHFSNFCSLSLSNNNRERLSVIMQSSSSPRQQTCLRLAQHSILSNLGREHALLKMCLCWSHATLERLPQALYEEREEVELMLSCGHQRMNRTIIISAWLYLCDLSVESDQLHVAGHYSSPYTEDNAFG